MRAPFVAQLRPLCSATSAEPGLASPCPRAGEDAPAAPTNGMSALVFADSSSAFGAGAPLAVFHLAYADSESALFFSRRGAPVSAAAAEGEVVQGGSWAQAPLRSPPRPHHA